jgi:hypothetical protein
MQSLTSEGTVFQLEGNKRLTILPYGSLAQIELKKTGKMDFFPVQILINK